MGRVQPDEDQPGQVRDNIGLSFAATLRSFLRQDPNIILVGEIRDAGRLDWRESRSPGTSCLDPPYQRRAEQRQPAHQHGISRSSSPTRSTSWRRSGSSGASASTAKGRRRFPNTG
jgi:hypothetical protein